MYTVRTAVLNSGPISLVSNYTTCGGGERGLKVQC